MAQYQNAADTLVRLANQFQGMMDAAAAIQELAGMQNAIEALGTQLMDAKVATSAATADLAAAKDLAVSNATRAEDIRVAGLSEANQLIADAKAEVERLMADAQEQADEAKAIADQSYEDAAAKAEAKQSAYQASIVSLRATTEALEAKRISQQEVLDELTQQTASIRAALTKMIG